ncbi:hypothetical protein EBME_0291 [bacterium endosymbiont of Mortierella elongata FMR23-6]|nr:hypothetical protein EBME_0291 [bacterium endosymbiont of Mortierella elongata FMR23-6]
MRHLDLSNNALSHVPDGIGNLRKLALLNLSSNQLSGLPEALGNLSQLTLSTSITIA